jgi:glycolate oxidase iron-sulfur subunit
MAHPDLCCGSAGLYMLTQTDMARRILVDKLQEVHATGADTVVTANPGCMLQLQSGLDGPVKHVVELLDESYVVARGRALARPAGPSGDHAPGISR